MSVLSELVDRQAKLAVLGTFSRTVEKVAESMAEELLRQPDIRAKFLALISVAVQNALTELQAPSSPQE